jgi:hypothetical protein
MFPERTSFNIIDESYRREIHVVLSFFVNDCFSGNICRVGRTWKRSFDRHTLFITDSWAVLCRAEDVWHEGVIVQAPHSMRPSRLEGVCEDQPTNDFQVTMMDLEFYFQKHIKSMTYGSMIPRTMLLSKAPFLEASLANPPSFQIQPKNTRKLSSWPVP